MSGKRILILFALYFSMPFVLVARPVYTLDQLRRAPSNATCEIKRRIDLKGETITLNPNLTIVFKGGSIYGGTLIGNETHLDMGKDFFDDVVIKGTWLAPNISSSMFKDLSHTNSIRNVFALTNPRLFNKVIIEKGTYWVDVADAKPAIVLEDNITVEVNGTIKLKANSKTAYSIVSIKGNNVQICGNGKIVGDRDKHLGDKGEWGMGIMLSRASNIIIRDIEISNCWGDGIYINERSEKILIHDCDFRYCRRQGISITDAIDVTIRDCSFSNIGGTSPGLAIDVEPNVDKTVRQVSISGIQVKNCESGISVSNRAKGSSIGDITIKKSSFYGTKKNYSVLVSGARKAVVDSCFIDSGKSTALWLSEVDSAYCRANLIKSSSKMPINRYRCRKLIMDNNSLL